MPRRRRPRSCAVTGGGVTKRVPIVVVGVKPAAADVASLQTIATNSGGVYRSATTAFDVTAAVDCAVQLGFARSRRLRCRHGQRVPAGQPGRRYGQSQEREGHHRHALPNTDINSTPGGVHLPQRSNFMFTAGFTLPGFDGSLRAFRDLQTGRRLDQADRVEIRRTTARSCGPISTAVHRWQGRRASRWIRTRGTSIPTSRTAAAADRWWRSPRRTPRRWAPRMGTYGDDEQPHHRRPRAAHRRHHRLDAGDHGRAVARSAARRRLRARRTRPARLPATTTTARAHHLRRRERRHDARDRRAHGLRGVGVHPLQPAAEAATLRDGQAVDQFDYFVDSSPKIAEVKIERRAGAACCCSARARAGPSTRPSTSPRRGWASIRTLDDLGAVTSMLAAVRHARRIDRVQVGVPELQQLRSDLLRRPSRWPTERPVAS